MASPLSFQFVLLSAVLFLMTSAVPSITAKTSFQPKALVLPVSKDPSSLQYITHINQRTPLVPVKLVIDLGGKVIWVDCSQGYISSTRHVTHCGSAKCSLGYKPLCRAHMCLTNAHNPYFGTTPASVTQDVFSIQSTNGSNIDRNVTIPRFIFSCVPPDAVFLQGLANGALGMVGLGRARTALHSQFAAAFNLPMKFAMCLTSSLTSKGIIYLGVGPYMIHPIGDVSKSFTYTPLIIKRKIDADFSMGPPGEYFLGVKKIIIGKNTIVSFNTSLLSIDKNGYGGTEISTARPYTVLHSLIYKSFNEAFIKEASSLGLIRVASVEPFEICFSSRNIASTSVGPAVPTIDLVLQKKTVVWRIFGANSMVKVNDDILCLGFVDGGWLPSSSIVLGGYQLEDNLLQFDVAKLRLGFSSSLFLKGTACSNSILKTNAW